MKTHFYRIGITFLCLCVTQWITAQQTLINREWSTGTPGQNFYQRTVVKTNVANDVYTLGSTMVTPINYDFLLVKTDGTTGDTIYIAQFNGGGNDIAADFVISPSGSVYIAGGSYNGAISTDSLDPVIVKFDPAGNFEYSVYYSNSSAYNDGFSSIDYGTDDYIYAGGTVGTASDGQNYLTAKFDTTGSSEAWADEYDYAGYHDAVVKIQAFVSGGNVIVWGGSQPNAGEWDYYFRSLDISTGAMQKQGRYFGGGGVLQAVSDLEYANGLYYVTGSEYDLLTGYDMGILVLNDSLQLVWRDAFDREGLDDKSYGLDVDPSGNVYITGFVTPDNGSFSKNKMVIAYDNGYFT